MLNISYTGTAGHLYHLLTGKDHPKATKLFRNSLTEKSGFKELIEAKKEFDIQVNKTQASLEAAKNLTKLVLSHRSPALTSSGNQ